MWSFEQVLRITIVYLTAFVVLVGLIAGASLIATHKRHETLQVAIKAGAHPIDAFCSIQADFSDREVTVCRERARGAQR